MSTFTTIYLMTDEQLASEIETTKRKYAELMDEQHKREQWSPEMKLSIRLHAKLCRGRDCDFYYQFGPNAGTNIAEPAEYQKMARGLLSNFTADQIEVISNILSK